MRHLLAFLIGAALAWGITNAHAQNTPPNPVTVQGFYNVPPVECETPANQRIVTGGTAKNLFGSNINLTIVKAFIIQNVDTTEPLCMTFTGTTPTCGQPGTFVIPAGTVSTFAGLGSFSSPLGAGFNISPRVVAATTNHPYACILW